MGKYGRCSRSSKSLMIGRRNFVINVASTAGITVLKFFEKTNKWKRLDRITVESIQISFEKIIIIEWKGIICSS